MEMNVIRTNRDTRSPAKLGSVGGLVVVPDEDAVKGSTGLGAESTSRQQNASMSLIDSHKSDPPSTTTLVVPSSNSCQVFDSPAPANGSLGQLMRGLSTSGAEVDNVVVVATVASSTSKLLTSLCFSCTCK